MKTSITVAELLLISKGEFITRDAGGQIDIWNNKPTFGDALFCWIDAVILKPCCNKSFNIEIPEHWKTDPSKAIMSRKQAEQYLKDTLPTKNKSNLFNVGQLIEYKAKNYKIHSIDTQNGLCELDEFPKGERLLTTIEAVKANLGRGKKANRNAAAALQAIQDLFEDKHITGGTNGVSFHYVKEGLFRKLHPSIEKEFYDNYAVIEKYLDGE